MFQGEILSAHLCPSPFHLFQFPNWLYRKKCERLLKFLSNHLYYKEYLTDLFFLWEVRVKLKIILAQKLLMAELVFFFKSASGEICTIPHFYPLCMKSTFFFCLYLLFQINIPLQLFHALFGNRNTLRKCMQDFDKMMATMQTEAESLLLSSVSQTGRTWGYL